MVAVPARVHERDQIVFQSVLPVVEIVGRDHRRQPTNGGQHKASRQPAAPRNGGIPPVTRGIRNQCCAARAKTGSIALIADARAVFLPSVCIPELKPRSSKDHLIEVEAAATAGLPARTGERMLDHGAPKRRELLGRLDRPQSVGEPIPEEAFDPLMGGRTQFQDRLPQRSRVLGRRQTRNGASHDAEDPAVEFTREAVDLLIARIVNVRDELKDKTEKQANEIRAICAARRGRADPDSATRRRTR